MTIKTIWGEGTDVKGIHVTLSRRNLLALLTKLDMPGSKRTILRECDWLGGIITLVVEAQEDADHYGAQAPGAMHPATEEAIATRRDRWPL